MEKVLILVRGVSGSGKSTFAKLLGTKAICCADDYLMVNGEYIWEYWLLGRAHEWCERKCERFMKINAQRIAITNTLITEKELRPYLNLAKIYNYKVFSIIVENRMFTKNIHSVPNETILKMKSKFQISL